MNKEKDELDGFLKSKLEQTGIPFKESYWIAAQQTLREKSTFQKRYLWYLLPLFIIPFVFILSNTFVQNLHTKLAKSSTNPRELFSEKQLKNINTLKNYEASTPQQKTDYTNLLIASSNKALTETNKSNLYNIENKAFHKQDEKVITEKHHITSSPASSNQKTNTELGIHMEEPLLAKVSEEFSSYRSDMELNSPSFIEPYKFSGFKINPSPSPEFIPGKSILDEKRKKFISYYSISAGIQMNNQGIPGFHLNGFRHIQANHQLSFYTGLGFLQTTPELGKRTYTESIYGFGESSKSISIQTQKLNYLSLPLGIAFKVKGRHELNLSASYLYLIGSSDRFFYYENGKLVNSEFKSSYISLFNQHDVLSELNYAYWLNTKCKISLAYFRGLFNISDSKLFEFSNKNKNNGFKLGIHYQFN